MSHALEDLYVHIGIWVYRHNYLYWLRRIDGLGPLRKQCLPRGQKAAVSTDVSRIIRACCIHSCGRTATRQSLALCEGDIVRGWFVRLLRMLEGGQMRGKTSTLSTFRLNKSYIGICLYNHCVELVLSFGFSLKA